MKNKKKLSIIITILIIVGSILILVGLGMGTRKGVYFSETGMHIIGEEMQEKKQEVLEPIKAIEINVEELNIVFEEADSYTVETGIYEEESQVDWKIENNVLKINEKQKSKFRFFSFDFRSLYGGQAPYLKIYLPKDAQLDQVSITINDSNLIIPKLDSKELTIENKYGKIELEKIKTNNAQIKMQDGRIQAKEITAQEFILNNKYGKINLNDINTQVLQIEAEDGKVELEKIKTEKMNIKSKYGKIIGKEIQTSNSKIEAKDGSIDLEGDFTADTEIISTYGEVKLELKKERSYYNLNLDTKYGKITLDEEKIKDKTAYITNQENGKALKINAKDGNIIIDFNS